MLRQFIKNLGNACDRSGVHAVSMYRAFYIALNALGKKADDEGALDQAWSLINTARATGRFIITPPNCFGNRFIVAIK